MDNQINPNPINPTPTYSTQPTTVKNKPPIVVIVVIVIIVLAIIGMVMSKNNKNVQTNIAITPTQEPSPTPAPQVDKQTVKIQVLNGTGTPGQATTVVTELKASGFNADNIKTDNADKFDQTTTTIAAKAGFTVIADEIKAALNSTFDSINIDPTELGSESDYDIVITTGGKLYETPTPKVLPTTSPTSGPTSTPGPTTTPANTPTPTITPTPTP